MQQIRGKYSPAKFLPRRKKIVLKEQEMIRASLYCMKFELNSLLTGRSINIRKQTQENSYSCLELQDEHDDAPTDHTKHPCLTLNFVDCPSLSNFSFSKIAELHNLISLNVSGCKNFDPFTGVSFLKGLKHLQHLDLSKTQLRDCHISDLTSWFGGQLKSLNIAYNIITDLSLPVLCSGMKTLESLNLSRTKVTDDGIKIICESPLSATLKQLTLISTGVTPAAAVHFKKLDALQVLQLRGTVYADKGIDKLQSNFMTMLQYLTGVGTLKENPNNVAIKVLAGLHLNITKRGDNAKIQNIDNYSNACQSLWNIEALKNWILEPENMFRERTRIDSFLSKLQTETTPDTVCTVEGTQPPTSPKKKESIQCTQPTTPSSPQLLPMGTPSPSISALPVTPEVHSLNEISPTLPTNTPRSSTLSPIPIKMLSSSRDVYDFDGDDFGATAEDMPSPVSKPSPKKRKRSNTTADKTRTPKLQKQNLSPQSQPNQSPDASQTNPPSVASSVPSSPSSSSSIATSNPTQTSTPITPKRTKRNADLLKYLEVTVDATIRIPKKPVESETNKHSHSLTPTPAATSSPSKKRRRTRSTNVSTDTVECIHRDKRKKLCEDTVAAEETNAPIKMKRSGITRNVMLQLLAKGQQLAFYSSTEKMLKSRKLTGNSNHDIDANDNANHQLKSEDERIEEYISQLSKEERSELDRLEEGTRRLRILHIINKRTVRKPQRFSIVWNSVSIAKSKRRKAHRVH